MIGETMDTWYHKTYEKGDCVYQGYFAKFKTSDPDDERRWGELKPVCIWYIGGIDSDEEFDFDEEGTAEPLAKISPKKVKFGNSVLKLIEQGVPLEKLSYRFDDWHPDPSTNIPAEQMKLLE